MSNLPNGSSDMGCFVLRTRLIENPNVVFYYKGTDSDGDASFSLNTIVAFEISDALMMDQDEANRLCERLNADKDALISNGYEEFEVVLVR